MTQIINKDEVQATPSKKLKIKIAKNIDQAKFMLNKIANRTSGSHRLASHGLFLRCLMRHRACQRSSSPYPGAREQLQ